MTEQPNLTLSEMLATVETLVDRIISDGLAEVDGRALGVMSKAPFKLLVARESIAHRTEELARSALAMWKAQQYVASATLARSLMESVAFQYKLLDVIAKRSQTDPDAIEDVLHRLVLGERGNPNHPDAINILSLVKLKSKQNTNFAALYDKLSQIVHPNFSGVSLLYCVEIDDPFTVNIERNEVEMHSVKVCALVTMFVCLHYFLADRAEISLRIPAWLSDLEKMPQA